MKASPPTAEAMPAISEYVRVGLSAAVFRGGSGSVDVNTAEMGLGGVGFGDDSLGYRGSSCRGLPLAVGRDDVSMRRKNWMDVVSIRLDVNGTIVLLGLE